MELKDLIKKNLPELKKILFGDEKIEVEMGEAKLSDGVTIVKWEGELAVGSMLFVVSEEGVTPAPDGTHELEDGRTIVSMDGKVSEVKTKEVEKGVEEEVEVDMEKVFNTYKEKFATGTPEDRIAILETLVKALFEDRFSWKLNEKKSEQMVNDALTAYQTKFEAEKTESNQKFEALKSQNETLKTSLKLMFEVIEKISGEPQDVEEIQPDIKDKKKTDLFSQIEEVAKILNTK